MKFLLILFTLKPIPLLMGKQINLRTQKLTKTLQTLKLNLFNKNDYV
jgi:hypothetical protein